MGFMVCVFERAGNRSEGFAVLEVFEVLTIF